MVAMPSSVSFSPVAPPSPGRLLSRLLMLTLAAAGAGNASELVVRDVNFAIELLPSAFDYTADGNTSRSGSDEFDRAIGIAIGCPYSFAGPGDSHGFLASGELAFSQATYGSIGHLTRYGVRIAGGYGYAFNDAISFSAMAKVGYGMATFDLSANSGFPALSASGTTLTYGPVPGRGAGWLSEDVGFALRQRCRHHHRQCRLGTGIRLLLPLLQFTADLGVNAMQRSRHQQADGRQTQGGRHGC